MSYAQIQRRRSNLARRLTQKPLNRLLGIAFNDQPLFSGSAFTLSALRFWLFRHLVLLSRQFRLRVDLVPQPGIGPGCPKRARECKSRLYASSSTGALNLPLERNVFVGYRACPPPPKEDICTLLLSFDLSSLLKSAKDFVNRSHWHGEVREIEPALKEMYLHIFSGEPLVAVFENAANGVSDSHSDQVIVPRKIGQWSQMIENLIEMGDLLLHFHKFVFKVCTSVHRRRLFLAEREPRFFKILCVHNSGAYPHV